MSSRQWTIMVTGGAGYVGSILIPKLLQAGHKVTVLDLYLYGDDIFGDFGSDQNLKQIKGDIRDAETVQRALEGCDAVIHLACISNDPSYDLNPDLGRSINHLAFRPLVQMSKAAGVERFIYASSSSVYGIKNDEFVTEDLPLEPLTDYSKFKAICEAELAEEHQEGFVTCVVRPATVCGYAPRQRLDVIVNILASHAYNNGRIRVFGGSQKRPNIHIEDMTDLYLFLLDQPGEKIDGKIYNAGYENHTLLDIAGIVKSVIGEDLTVDIEPTDDLRSYHVSSEKMRLELGFQPTHTIEDAVRDLVEAFKDERLIDPMNNPYYYNIKRMQDLDIK